VAIPHAQPGDVVSVRPLGAGLAQTKTTTLIKTEHVEVLRVVLPHGKQLPRHEAPGEVTLQCLEGQVRLDLGDRVVELSAGELMYLEERRSHDVQALQDSTILATILLVRAQPIAWPSVLAEELKELQ
jgi:quercetin dioxygenase-like cupin family protein